MRPPAANLETFSLRGGSTSMWPFTPSSVGAAIWCVSTAICLSVVVRGRRRDLRDVDTQQDDVRRVSCEPCSPCRPPLVSGSSVVFPSI